MRAHPLHPIPPRPTLLLTRARAGLGEKGAITEAVTSDAAYPYYYIHRNFVQELLGLQVSTTTTLAHVSCKCMFPHRCRRLRSPRS